MSIRKTAQRKIPRMLAGLVLLFLVATQCLYFKRNSSDITDPGSPAFWLLSSFLGDVTFAILVVTPASSTSDVAVNSNVEMEFNRQVDPNTVTVQDSDGDCSGSIQLSPDNFASCVGMSVDLSRNPRLLFQPLADLASNTTYRLRITAAVSSIDGQPLGAQTVLEFTTAAPADTTAPADVTVAGSAPQANGDIDVNWTNPTDSDFAGVRVLRVLGAVCTTDPNDGAATVVYNSGGTSFTDTGLTHGQQYCYTIFAYDTAGNFAPGAGPGAQTTATSNDTVGPTVVSVSPVSSASGIALNQTVSVTFSEPMTNGTIGGATSDGACVGSIQVQVGPGFATCKGFTVSTSDSITYTFTPAGNHLDLIEYRINVTTAAQDAAGNALGAAFNQSPGYTTGDFTAPTVANVTSTTADATYGIGSVINVQVQFTENITVNTGGGTPYITLETGGTDVNASFTTVTGGDTMNFTFTVANPHVAADLDYISTAALVANGGTIQDGSANNAVLTLPAPAAAGSLGNNKAIVIDGVPPTVSNVTSSTADATYGAGGTITVQVQFSEPITVTVGGGSVTITLETGATDATVNYTTTTGGDTAEFDYTVAVGHSSADLDYQASNALVVTAPAMIQDAAGNDATVLLASPGAAGSLGANKALVVNGVVTSMLPDTGQTTCFYESPPGTWNADATCSAGAYVPGDATYPFGQDAHYTDTPAAFTLTPTNGNTTVTESTTGLIFENGVGSIGTVDPTTASTSCAALGTAGLTWRLPTTRELLMHYNLNLSNPAVDTGANLFIGTAGGTFYWTADASGLVGGEQFNIAGNYPRIQDDPVGSASRTARCVSGPAYPAPNYTTSNVTTDYMVYDSTSNLKWTKCSVNGAGTVLDAGGGTCTLPVAATHDMNWAAALQVCENLSYGGHTDWRLPNFRELLSIVEWTNGPPTLINVTEFPANAGGPSGFYWSSTTYIGSVNNAQVFNFGTGRAYAIIEGAKTNLYFTRCVRTGP